MFVPYAPRNGESLVTRGGKCGTRPSGVLACELLDLDPAKQEKVGTRSSLYNLYPEWLGRLGNKSNYSICRTKPS